jgi:hypothetical protein
MTDSTRVKPIVGPLTPQGLAGALREVYGIRARGDPPRGSQTDKRRPQPNVREVPDELYTFIARLDKAERGTKFFAHGLKSVQDWARKAGYAPESLWIRPAATLSYALLVELVFHLGLPRRLNSEATPPRDPLAVEKENRNEVRDACRRFCELIEPSCETAYYYDRSSNRSAFLYQHGLWYPETMEGISWTNDAPRRVLFDDSSGPWCLSLSSDGQPEIIEDQIGGIGSFRFRENVETMWAYQARWDRSRLALFLNWRNGQKPKYRDNDIGTGDMRLAWRYLVGWLAISRSNVVGDHLRRDQYSRLPVVPGTIIEQVARVFDRPDEWEKGEALESAIHTALNIENPRLRSVHWVASDLTSPKPERNTLVFRRGAYPNQPTDHPAFRLKDPQEGMVDASISAQCASWGVPILIRNMDDPMANEHLRHWRDLDVPHRTDEGEEWKTLSEMAVPIKRSNGNPRGVICVEHSEPNALTPAHVHRAQLVGHLFSRLEELKASDTAGHYWSFAQKLCTAGLPSGNKLFKEFCQWIVNDGKINATADLAYVLTYDGSARVFRPLGVSTSERFQREYIKHERLEKKISSSVLEDGLIRWLLPKTRGRSWRALMQLEPVCVWFVDENLRPPTSELSQKYFKTLLGLPLVGETNAQPDGVLWLRWMEQPVSRWHTEKKLVNGILNIIDPMIPVVSAIYAVYRFCGREDDTLVGKNRPT